MKTPLAQRWTDIVASSAASLWWAVVADAAGRELFPEPAPESFFLVLFLFSLFGGLGRMLFLWRRAIPWQRQCGSLMLSVFGSWLVALYFWESSLPSAELLAAAGAMAAIGGEVVEQVGRVVAGRLFGATRSAGVARAASLAAAGKGADMNGVIAWFSSEMGRRVLVWGSGALALAVQGGILPLDYPIGPWSLGQLLQFLGIGVAATAGSSSRK